MRHYPGVTARKWYDLQILDQKPAYWEKWKRSFLVAFQCNPLERWELALRFRHTRGSLLEYCLEKRRLLRMAEPELSSLAVIALVMLGLSLSIRKQVQLKAPDTIDDLMRCLKNLPVEPAQESP